MGRQQTHFLENIKKKYMGRQQTVDTFFRKNKNKYMGRQQTHFLENIKKNIWVDSRHIFQKI